MDKVYRLKGSLTINRSSINRWHPYCRLILPTALFSSNSWCI